MTATILAFPTDRCRKPLSVIEAAEREAFGRAASEHAGADFHGPSICAMMALALEGSCSITAAKAAAWLHEQYDIQVA